MFLTGVASGVCLRHRGVRLPDVAPLTRDCQLVHKVRGFRCKVLAESAAETIFKVALHPETSSHKPKSLSFSYLPARDTRNCNLPELIPKPL